MPNSNVQQIKADTKVQEQSKKEERWEKSGDFKAPSPHIPERFSGPLDVIRDQTYTNLDETAAVSFITIHGFKDKAIRLTVGIRENLREQIKKSIADNGFPPFSYYYSYSPNSSYFLFVNNLKRLALFLQLLSDFCPISSISDQITQTIKPHLLEKADIKDWLKVGDFSNTFRGWEQQKAVTYTSCNVNSKVNYMQLKDLNQVKVILIIDIKEECFDKIAQELHKKLIGLEKHGTAFMCTIASNETLADVLAVFAQLEPTLKYITDDIKASYALLWTKPKESKPVSVIPASIFNPSKSDAKAEKKDSLDLSAPPP